MSDRPLVLGTRGSTLALAQTSLATEALRRVAPQRELRVERIATTGDVRAHVPLSELGRGIFVTEIEAALREGRIDIAVHSAKDLPSTTPPDLVIGAFLPRADARDVLVSRWTLETLPRGARVGTSSPRRACQLRAARPDLELVEMRGNVDTRLRKLAAGDYDAIVLAAAGLERLGRADEVRERFDVASIIPCPGQGAIAIEARREDAETLALLREVDHLATRQAVEAERELLAELGAGCRAAVGAHARVADGSLELTGMIGTREGQIVRGSRSGPAPDGTRIGAQLARELLVQGGAPFLAPAESALRGKRIAITRPESERDALVAVLRARGADVIACPVIATAPVSDIEGAMKALERCRWLVFTSANAVPAVADALTVGGLPAQVRVAAVGNATAAAVAERLGRVDFVASVATAESLAREIPLATGDVVLFPRGSLAGETLPTILRQRGAVVHDVVVYTTVAAPGAHRLAELIRSGVDAIVLTSPSALTLAPGAVDALRSSGIGPAIVTMGATTARTVQDIGRAPVVPASPSVGAIAEALEHALSPSTVHVATS